MQKSFSKYFLTFIALSFVGLIPGITFSQTIAEKKSSFETDRSDLSIDIQKHLRTVNNDLKQSQRQLQELYSQVDALYNSNAPDSAYEDLLKEINQLKNEITQTEKSWEELASDATPTDNYALWNQQETTIGQLIIDYGSQDYVYIFTPDIASLVIHVDSNLPIPRASWDQMLELILTQNGIGIKQLNPFLRQLYLVKSDHSNLKMITNNKNDLDILPPDARVLFVLSPEPSEVKRIWYFLDKFINPNSTVLQLIGRDILIVAPVSDVKELLKLNEFVASNKGDRDYKVIPLRRTDPEEMGKILSAIFDQTAETPATLEKAPDNNEKVSQRLERLANLARNNNSSSSKSSSSIEINGLRIIPLGSTTPALFLYGTREELRKAENIIVEIESHMAGTREKVIFWYTTKHTDPAELSDILMRVYNLMVTERPNLGMSRVPLDPNGQPIGPPPPGVNPFLQRPPITPEQQETGIYGQPFPQFNAFEGSFYLDDRYIVNSDPREEINRNVDPNRGRTNFIVDPKTSAIVMVVETEVLPKLKELIRKLDVPKKMVQIEVLLFEKRVSNRDNIGLNLLKIGSDAINKNLTGLDFNANHFEFDPIRRLLPDISGITTFFISRKKNHMLPAYDAVYQFLIAQEDITINANPSVLAINQTEAHIAIEEEISVNTGVIITPVTNTTALNETYARARYGIKIDITPTIHMRECGDFEEDCSDIGFGEESDYVTLKTDLVFETIQPGLQPSRPDVIRRVINNEVRIPDGQTVILGGLRRKVTDDHKEAIPFIGELPGIGKLFSSTRMRDNSVEMFIFLTPKIITDPKDELERYRYVELTRRPGDIPYFLCQLEEARNAEKNRLMKGTMQLLFGREKERCGPLPMSEYDGR